MHATESELKLVAALVKDTPTADANSSGKQVLRSRRRKHAWPLRRTAPKYVQPARELRDSLSNFDHYSC